MKYTIQYTNMQTTSLKKIKEYFGNDNTPLSKEIINLYTFLNKCTSSEIDLKIVKQKFPKFYKFMHTPQISIYTTHKNMYRNLLIHLMSDRGVSIRQLSIEAEVSYSTLYRFIKGDNSKLSLHNLDNITNMLQRVL